MGISCLFGHKWTGCKCTRCGKVRDEAHDWSKDCEKCLICGKVRIGVHAWNGCKCTKCGKVNDDAHDWSKDCEKCLICGKVNDDAHDWKGCKCTKCGKVRDKVVFIRKENNHHPTAPQINITKIIYKAENKQDALEFLKKQKVTEPFYYIEVNTPEGLFGIDNAERIYDSRGQFIEDVPKPEKIVYDKDTEQIKELVKSGMDSKTLLIPNDFLSIGDKALQGLRFIIEDASADFYMRRFALWWGFQFHNNEFNAFLKKRFVEGKDKKTLMYKADSSRSDHDEAELGLYIAANDVLNGDYMWEI